MQNLPSYFDLLPNIKPLLKSQDCKDIDQQRLRRWSQNVAILDWQSQTNGISRPLLVALAQDTTLLATKLKPLEDNTQKLNTISLLIQQVEQVANWLGSELKDASLKPTQSTPPQTHSAAEAQNNSETMTHSQQQAQQQLEQQHTSANMTKPNDNRYEQYLDQLFT